MTTEQFKQIHDETRVSARRLAHLLGLQSGRHIRAIRAGTTTVTGPISICMTLIDKLGVEAYVRLLEE